MSPLAGVSKTAVLTLRARADEHRRPDRLFVDPAAAAWLRKLEWPPELDLWYSPRVQSFLAFRAHEIDEYTRAHVARWPGATVVELGCGLSSRFLRVPGAEQWIDLDLPEVIAARETLGASGPGHRHLARSVLDRSWLDEIPIAVDASKLFLIAEGLLYYLPRAEVDLLFLDLRRRFPGATIAFDVLGALDWEATLTRSSAVGAGVQWMIDPPFGKALGEFGLSPVPGSEPDAVVHALIDRYWPRFGAATHWAVRSLARVPYFRGKRSGTLLGRLQPILL